MYPLRSSTGSRASACQGTTPCPAGDSKPGSVGGGSLAGPSLLRSARCARDRLFVVFVVVTLAFGIGANTTVFSVLNVLFC